MPVRGAGTPHTIVERLGTAFAWVAPALIVGLELVGSAVEQSLGTSLLLLALFLGALWLPIAPETAATTPVARPFIRRAAGGALLLVGLSLFAFGMARLIEPARIASASLPLWLRGHTWSVLLPMLAAWPAALGLPWLLGRKPTGRDLERAGILVALVFLAMLGQKVRVQGLFVLPYAKPWLASVLPALAAVLALLLIVPRVSPVARFGLVVACGLTLRVIGLGTWKLDPAVRDMLPLVQSAQDAFLSGANPYDIHPMQRGSQVPLTYLPGMWMLHGIPRLLGLDLRITGVVADGLLAACLWWAASGVAPRFRARAHGLAFTFAAAWLFSPSVHWNGIYAEPHAWWLVLAVLLAAMLRRRYWLAAGALGLALATRHFAVVVAPFVVVAMVRAIGLRATLPRLGLTGALAALLLVPFALRDPEMFWFGTYRWLVEYGPAHQSWFWFKYGFSGPLYQANSTEWMPRAQVAIVLAMLGVSLLLRSRRALLAVAGTAYVGFVMFNGIIWDSFYLGAALFPAFAAAASHHAAPEAARVARPLPRAVHATALALFAISALFGVWLIVTFVRSMSRAGIADARAFVKRAAKPGDALVDRSDFALAFVRHRPFLDGASPLRQIARDPLDVFAAERIWLVTRNARDAALRRDTKSIAASLIADERFGRYRVVAISPRPIQHQLSRLTEQLAPAFSPAAGVAPEPLASTGAGRWLSNAVSFVEVASRQCRIGGSSRAMIFAHPAEGGELRLTFSEIELGQQLVVVGALEDPAVVWRRSSVRVTARVGDAPVGTLVIVNRAGTQWAAFDTASYRGGRHRVELVVTTTDDTGRLLCIDGLVLNAEPKIRDK
jgi:hypothetical protein